ncbi:MAG: hypothetical protein K2M30_02350 [Desulfovibrionaceae bacterium]|nr:hypothetical protein [Desulfovibrionaceae bacterium]
MILFRGLSLACLWYLICVIDTPLLFDIHLHAEEHCSTVQTFILEHFDVYIEHPLYFGILGLLGIVLYTIGAILDSTFSIISVLGVTAVIGYLLYFT